MVGIDTGGTFTDAFFSRDGEFRRAKVLTTPHDLTVCLADCIKGGASLFGLSLTDMLKNTDIVRYSSTIGVNTIIQKTGSKIGLIVSRGFKDSLYSKKEAKEVEPIYSFVSQDLIVEIKGEIDAQGKITKSIDRDEVISKMQYLVDMGVRGIVVSLKNSYINPTHEKQVRDIIKEQSPSFYLGSVRVFLASEISGQPGDFYRTNAAIINGYIHESLAKHLYKAEDDLRANLYARPLMIGHSHGGAARVAKTRAIDTYSSGPVFGMFAAELVGRMSGFGNVVSVDMGGTSLDLGVIRDGVYSFSLTPSISGLPIGVPMIITYSVGLGGGSIVSLTSSKSLQIGPRSAGASPGPACFDLGGLEPTVTDADVALGFIDPNYFLGGKVKLNKQRAISSIKARIADRLGITVEEAGYLIRETTDEMIQRELLQFLERQATQAKKLRDFALVVYGGAGPTHCCGFARGLRFGQILTSPYSSVFSAFGFSTTDLLHPYAKSHRIMLFDGVNYLTDYEKFNQVVKELVDLARRDIRGEGFSPDDAIYYLELVGDEDLAGIKIRANNIYLNSEKDVKNLCTQFGRSTKQGQGKVIISTIVLNAAVPLPHSELKPSSLASESPKSAFKGEQEVFWSPEVGYQKTPIYERELLVPGNVVLGPAIVRATDTTYVIPVNWSFSVDKYSHGVLREV